MIYVPCICDAAFFDLMIPPFYYRVRHGSVQPCMLPTDVWQLSKLCIAHDSSTPGNLGEGLTPGIVLFTNDGGRSCAITVLRSDCCPTTQTEVVLAGMTS